MKLLLNVHFMTFVFLSGSALIAQELSIDNLFAEHKSWRDRFNTVKTMPVLNREQKEEKILAINAYVSDLYNYQIGMRNRRVFIQGQHLMECQNINNNSEEFVPCMRILSFIQTQEMVEESIKKDIEQVQQLHQNLLESLAHDVENQNSEQSKVSGEQSEPSVESNAPAQE